MGDFRQFTFADASVGETSKVAEVLEPYFNISIGRHRDDPMELGVSMRRVSGSYVTRQWLAGVVTRCQAPHISRDGDEHLTLFVSLSGKSAKINLPDRRHGRDEVELRPDTAACLKGNEERSSITFSGCDSLAIPVPRSSVIPAMSDLDGALYRGVPRSPALNLLTGYAKTLTSNIGSFTGKLSAQAEDTLTDLLVLALGPTRDGAEAAKGGARSARLAAIKADLRVNLAHPDFSLEWIARRHAVPPRSIQDLFYSVGESFNRYVRDTRLSHAHAALADPENAERRIAEIAFASGFGDISWFNNSFRKRFGRTPSDVRTMAAITHKSAS